MLPEPGNDEACDLRPVQVVVQLVTAALEHLEGHIAGELFRELDGLLRADVVIIRALEEQ